jgi:hypothetical protein
LNIFRRRSGERIDGKRGLVLVEFGLVIGAKTYNGGNDLRHGVLACLLRADEDDCGQWR